MDAIIAKNGDYEQVEKALEELGELAINLQKWLKIQDAKKRGEVTSIVELEDAVIGIEEESCDVMNVIKELSLIFEFKDRMTNNCDIKLHKVYEKIRK